MPLVIKQLDSGYWHIRGDGPCNWTQPKQWPCSEDEVRRSAFPQASEAFLLAVLLESAATSPATSATGEGLV